MYMHMHKHTRYPCLQAPTPGGKGDGNEAIAFTFTHTHTHTHTHTQVVGIMVNLLGFSVPIPLCISKNLKAHHIALLGYISPILALVTVAGYIFA